VIDQPEEEREGGAEEETRDDGEVEGGVFAAMDDVAGEAAEAEGEFASDVKKGAEGAAEFAKRVHPGILPEPAEKLFPPRISVS
jgi:hypothetical protein